MKNQYINLIKWLVGGAAVLIFLIIFEWKFANLLTQSETENVRNIVTIMNLSTMFVYVIFSAIISVLFFKKLEEYDKQELEKAKKILNGEFQTVTLRDSSSISKEKFECTAKIDEDGKIICKIHLDLEKKFENCEEFLCYFDFDS